ncbi:MAG: hypothetical protein A2Y33_09640 [Spirochaetes bacterium GWF1_51_8]|nr:MAG: hypothetical protein A2Y33_09640 [Spirochaetes bacterium GWF1_51_8]
MNEKVQPTWFMLFMAAIAITAPLFASSPAVTILPEAMPQIVKNLENTGYLLQTAQGYLNDLRENLQRIREIMVKGANGIYDKVDREIMITKMQELFDHCLRILEHAQFNAMCVFYNPETKESFNIYPVTLSPSEPTYKITIQSKNFGFKVLDELSKSLRPDVEYMNMGIGLVDVLLEAVCMEAAKIAAYQSRVEFAVKFASVIQTGNYNDAFIKGMTGLNIEIETRIFTLAVMSANGIYSSVDRQQIQLELNELFDELKRYEKITGVKNMSGELKAPSVLTQKDSEKLMLLMAEKFAKHKGNEN